MSEPRYMIGGIRRHRVIDSENGNVVASCHKPSQAAALCETLNTLLDTRNKALQRVEELAETIFSMQKGAPYEVFRSDGTWHARQWITAMSAIECAGDTPVDAIVALAKRVREERSK